MQHIQVSYIHRHEYIRVPPFSQYFDSENLILVAAANVVNKIHAQVMGGICTWGQVPGYVGPGARHLGPGTLYQVPQYQVPGTWYLVAGTRYQVQGT